LKGEGLSLVNRHAIVTGRRMCFASGSNGGTRRSDYEQPLVGSRLAGPDKTRTA
jgi:hypothetical protein